MASSKKPTYKVETKLVISERKRRKSDLVLMWQSMMDVTAIVVNELWTTIIRLWEFLQIWFSSSERFQVQTWLEKYLPYVPEDFLESWRDGRLLAILLNKLKPGCFPDAYHLDPDYGLKNVYRVFDSLEMYFGIKPDVSVEEIVTCSDGADSKLFEILFQLKNLTDSQPESKEVKLESSENIESSVEDQNCIVKGTGLTVGFVDRTSNFIILCSTISDLDVVIEIRGPNTICSERITNRSPRKRRSVFSFDCSRQLTRSASLCDDDNTIETEDNKLFVKRIIPLEYEILSNQINLSYKPREKGEHKVTILGHGQHVSDSPYFVTVEDPIEVIATKKVIPLKSAFRSTSVVEKHNSRKISFQVQEPENKVVKQECNGKYKEKIAGKVISRKLIRYIVRINGRDIPVNADSTQSLATELLKMDYDFETCPSFHRRNSWGFAGDAERKKSVIRQFGIDVKELDAQISHRRTRSLSINPVSKKLLERSDSFDSLTSKLNCLNEDVFENNGKVYENENDYAYIDEDINTTEANFADVTEDDIYSENNEDTATLLSGLTENEFDKSLKEHLNDATETDKISFLSINKMELEKVDRLQEDLHQNNSTCSSLKCNPIGIDNGDNMSMIYQCTDNNLLNDSLKCDDSIKNTNIVIRSKIFKQNFKVNICQKKIYKCSYKNAVIKGKPGRLTVHSFYRKMFKNKHFASLPLVVKYKKSHINIRRVFKTKKGTVSNVLKDIQTNIVKKKLTPNFKYGSTVSKFLPDEILNENLSIASKSASEENGFKFDNYEAKCVKNKELKTNSDVLSLYGYFPQHLRKEEEYKSLKNTLKEPEIEKVTIKENLNLNLNSPTYTVVKTKGENTFSNLEQISIFKPPKQIILNNSYISTSSNLTQARNKKTKPTLSKMCKPLRIHTLKSLGQFNFKQFNPPSDSISSISPIQSQIQHWENALSPDKEYVFLKKSHEAVDTNQVNVREKLAFWECRTKESPQRNSPENNRKMNSTVNKKSSLDNSECLRNGDLQKFHCSGNNSNIPVAITKYKNETSIEEETKAATTKQTDDTISPDFPTDSNKIRSLSFSDPVISEINTDKAENTINFSSSDSSRKEYSSSSSIEQYDSDDSDDSGGDYLLHSTEDEYIDDEITERASEYWGDLSIVKNWNMPQCPENEYLFLSDEILQNYNQRDKSYPEQCKVFGIAIYYGYVAVKNRFQVSTSDAGFGNLSISMQGVRRHEVSLISITYVRNDIYEVTYQVMTAGYYLISIRWMDRDISGSPFVCKITF